LDQIRVQVFLIVKIKEESESDEAALDKILLSAALITAAAAAAAAATAGVIGSDSSVIQEGDRAMGGWLPQRKESFSQEVQVTAAQQRARSITR